MGKFVIRDITGAQIEVTDLDKAIEQCERCANISCRMPSGYTVGENNAFMLERLIKMRKNRRVGIYSFKSPYRKKKMLLPFIILSRSESDHTYEVQTVEYEGRKRYKVQKDYGAGTIGQLILCGEITKCAEIAELPHYRNSKCKIGKLIALYYNAK